MKNSTQMPQLVVIMPSYNNEAYCFDSIRSIEEQSYPHYRLIYIDDASTDGTYDLAKLLLENFNPKTKATLIRNKERKGSLANFYKAVHGLDPKDIVVCVDGDDRLSSPSALERIAAEYENPDVWLTYGNFITDPPDPDRKLASKAYSKFVLDNGGFRDETFYAGHIKTFYAKLFQLIKKEDLTWTSGEFLPVCGDMGFMFPMLEMASEGHFRFIDEILYIYNINNPQNDHKMRKDALFKVGEFVRKLPRYQPLKRLF